MGNAIGRWFGRMYTHLTTPPAPSTHPAPSLKPLVWVGLILVIVLMTLPLTLGWLLVDLFLNMGGRGAQEHLNVGILSNVFRIIILFLLAPVATLVLWFIGVRFPRQKWVGLVGVAAIAGLLILGVTEALPDRGMWTKVLVIAVLIFALGEAFSLLAEGAERHFTGLRRLTAVVALCIVLIALLGGFFFPWVGAQWKASREVKVVERATPPPKATEETKLISLGPGEKVCFRPAHMLPHVRKRSWRMEPPAHGVVIAFAGDSQCTASSNPDPEPCQLGNIWHQELCLIAGDEPTGEFEFRVWERTI